MDKNRLLAVLPGIAGKRVLVVGDLFLDEYLVGKPVKISREAPVLVLEYEKRFALPGGGTNPACNLQALGVDTRMLGVVGADDAGTELRGLLEAIGIDSRGLVQDAGRPTITKTRILARDGNVVRQQVVRLDRLSRAPLDRAAVQELIDCLDASVEDVDAVLLSDYKSGVVCPEVVDACRQLAGRYGKLLTVDSQGDLYRFKGFGLVKANQRDAEATLGVSLDSDSAYDVACRRLLDDLGSSVVVITRGSEGMSVMEAGGSHIHIPVANRSEVFDVTGAGDTAIAVLTVAMAAGAEADVAAHLSNYAAGLVVRKIGNATTTVEEMAEAITSSQFPRVDRSQELV